MPTGQEIKFYFKLDTNLLLAVAVPLKKNITVLSWRKGKKITSSKISNILVDDRDDTIQRWNAAGGTGILYTSANQVINDLKKLGL